MSTLMSTPMSTRFGLQLSSWFSTPSPRSSNGARLALCLLATVSLAVLAQAKAQLLADVLVTTAISATFDNSVRFPSGSYSAVGVGADALIARVPGNDNWTDWEVYVARGLAANLQAGFVHNLATSFAVAGYFEAERAETSVVNGGVNEAHTRIVFDGPTGKRLLYLVRAGQEVAWLTARSR